MLVNLDELLELSLSCFTNKRVCDVVRLNEEWLCSELAGKKSEITFITKELRLNF